MSEELGYSKGLAGVIADETSISQVQGEVGRLIYRGVSIEDIVEKCSFEEVAYFLLKGKWPSAVDFADFDRLLKQNRALPKHAEAIIDAAPRSAHPMTVLQSVVASLSFSEGLTKISEEENNFKNAVKTISQMATAVAWISRDRRGLQPVEPREDLSHAENFLYMLQGEGADSKVARYFDIALILHMDHDFNASTFTGRVVSSSEARFGSSISAAVGSLSGALHGGANERVLRMADEIGDPDVAKQWVEDALANKRKIMGFGHRVYKKMDPRAKILRGMLEDLVQSAPEASQTTYKILKNVHDVMIETLGQKQKDYIWPNVDFWSGSLYRLLGVQAIDFTPIFAVARVVGWSSHILEQWGNNRIFRPSAKYVGPTEANVPQARK